MRKTLFLATLILAFGFWVNLHADIVKVGTKTIVNDSYSFKAEFVEKPKIGETILRVTLWDKDGKQITDLDIIGSYDMASMAGQHSMASKIVSTSKSGFYLFPIRLVMRGKWEVTLIFKTKAANDAPATELYIATIPVSI
ncbi:hypothetical protein AGMMS50229_17220 [Campylobacterota bacterium]|nr:hypothetical protein AGMMS50229_17220 [Campylobacterota bacterium]